MCQNLFPAFAAALIRAMPAGEMWRFRFPPVLEAFVFAHRAFCARLIRARAAADNVRLGFVKCLPPLIFPKTARAASTCLS